MTQPPLVLVSNRGPVTFDEQGNVSRGTGGLVTALTGLASHRDAVWVAGTMTRLGHPSIGQGAFQWLSRVRGQNRSYAYWFQKYTIDGWPEWETPAVDQTAMIPWGLERHFHRTGDTDFLAASWPVIEQAAQDVMLIGESPPIQGVRATARRVAGGTH
jgi:trehalose-6-phosphate synthase